MKAKSGSTARLQLAGTAWLASCMTLGLLAMLVMMGTAQAQSLSSLGVTGNLSSMVFATIPGGTILPTDNSMVLINDTGSAQTVLLRAEAANGVDVELSQPNGLELGTGDRAEVSITRISVQPQVVPGDYSVVVRALSPAHVAAEKEVTVVPGVAMRARLHIEGRAATLRVEPTDLRGQPIAAEVDVVYGTGEHWSTLYTGLGHSEYHVAPGTYRVQARLGGRILSVQEVTVHSGETRDVQLAIKTISFASVGAVPYRRSGRVLYYEVHYDVQNQLDPLQGVEIRLQVERDGAAVFTDVNRPGVLAPGLTSGKFVYAPDGRATGWGTYTLRLFLAKGGTVLTRSTPVKVSVVPQTPVEWVDYDLGKARRLWAQAPSWKRAVVMALAAVVVTVMAWLLRMFLRRRRQRATGNRLRRNPPPRGDSTGRTRHLAN